MAWTFIVKPWTFIREVIRRIYDKPLLVWWSIIVSLSGFYAGFIRSMLPQAQRSMEGEFGVTDLKLTVVLSIAVGAMLGTGISDKLGRTKALYFSICLCLAGTLVMTIALDLIMIYLGSMLIGLGLGMESMTVPLYVSEISPPKLRGLLFSFNSTMIAIANSMTVDIFTVFKEAPGSWRWMIGVGSVPLIVQGVLIKWNDLPESANWLYSKGMRLAATETVRRTYPRDEVHGVTENLRLGIPDDTEVFLSHGFLTKFFRAMKEADVRSAMLCALIVQIIQYVVGKHAVIYHKDKINIGWMISLVFTGLRASASFMNGILIDFLGCKWLILFSLFSIMCCLLILSLVSFFCSFEVCSNFTQLIINVYLVIHSMGLKSTPWILNTELYRLSYRGFGSGFGFLLSGFLNLFFSEAVVVVTDALGITASLLVYVICTITSMVIVYNLIPQPIRREAP